MKNLTFKTHNNTSVQTKLLNAFLFNNNVEIEFQAEPEDLAPDFDECIMNSFQKTLDSDSELQYTGVSHNWFCAKVTVSHKGFVSEQYLGGCSYASYNEFKKDGYYIDMISEGIGEINREINAKNEAIRKAWKFRKMLNLANELNYLVIEKSLINKL